MNLQEKGLQGKEPGQEMTEVKKDGGYKFREVKIRLREGEGLYSKARIQTPGDAIDVMRKELASFDREVVCIVNLNVKNQVINYTLNNPDLKPLNFNIVSIGNLQMSTADIPYLLRSCILANAGAFIMMHNHPSGDPFPSPEDIILTRRVVMAGAFMGIPCLDHVIVGAYGKEFYSMRENNSIDFEPGMDEAAREVGKATAESAVMYETPFGNVPVDEVLAASAAARGRERAQRPARERLTISFGRGLCSFFKSKAGMELCAVKIPGTTYESWPQFVLPADRVRDSRYGKGVWASLPADGRTTLSVSHRVEAADGSTAWQRETFVVSNRELKEMVEAYKKPRNHGSSNNDEPPEQERTAYQGR